MYMEVIKTEQSALVLYELDADKLELLKTCCETIDSLLDLKPEIIIYGKVCHQQRSVGFFSDESSGYNYSTSKTSAKKMKPCLIELLNYINEKFNAEFNGILINKYENGEDYIGKHSDDERSLDKTAGVIALSYGAIRKFRIRNKTDGKMIKDILTEQNKIMQMKGDFQKEFTHEIPVEKKIKTARYSLTFRRHL